MAATTVRELHAGDRLTFATVTAQLESDGAGGDETRTMTASPAGAVYHVDEQRADVINYAERQYNSHVQYVNAERENFLREVAATKTKARWLAWTGFAMFVTGFGMFAAADLSFIRGIADSIQDGSVSPPTSPFRAGSRGAFPSGWRAGRWARWECCC